MKKDIKLVSINKNRDESIKDCFVPMLEDLNGDGIKVFAAIWEAADGTVKISHYGDCYTKLGMTHALAGILMEDCRE
jgi:hypothetical protein